LKLNSSRRPFNIRKMGRRINDMLNCNEFREKRLYLTWKKIPQNHFTHMTKIERKSTDEPVMMIELKRE
jgi:hypothetical protein